MINTQPQIFSEIFKSRIFLIHDQKVILDEDIAQLQGMNTSRFNREMKRHLHLFPPDSKFRLTSEEFRTLRLHSSTSKAQGGRRHPPYVYTERGLQVVLSVLKRKHSTQVSLAVNNILENLHEIQKWTSELACKLEELAKTDILPLKIVSDAFPGVIPLPRRRLVGDSGIGMQRD